MTIKKASNADWKCKKCGKPTKAAGKVCMVCSTGKTVIMGDVKKASMRGAVGNKRPTIAKAPNICGSLSEALDLEVEGREFYLKCAERTAQEEGKEMFLYLANEESIHYGKISQLYERKEYAGFCKYVEAKGKKSGIFQMNVKGGNMDERSDALDALNIGIAAEDNSIGLYSKLANDAKDEELRDFFERLVAEERKHRSILENEAEFVTETGQFKDFKVVTM